MRRFFEILGIFDWVTPVNGLLHEIKGTQSDTFTLFVKSDNYPGALATLKRLGIKPVYKPVGLGIIGEWQIVIPYGELSTAASALDHAGVEYKYK